MENPAELLTHLLEQKPPSNRFNPSHPRVSAIGKCIRAQVARIAGLFPGEEVDDYYRRLGLVHQAMLAEDLRAVGCEVKEDTDRQPLEVRTDVFIDGESVYCHPDLWVKTPQGVVVGCQVKTLEGLAEEKLPEMERPYRAAYEQAQLEWHLWARPGEGSIRVCAWPSPQLYTVAYVGRSSAGVAKKFFEVKWEEQAMQVLRHRFRQMPVLREKVMVEGMKALPPRPYARPRPECEWDFGARGSWRCPGYAGCWS